MNSRCQWIGIIITPIYSILYYVFAFLGNEIEFPWNYLPFCGWFIFYYLGLLVCNDKRIGIKIDHCNIIIPILALIFSIFIQIIEGNFWYNIEMNTYIATTQIKISSIATTAITCILLIVCVRRIIFRSDNVLMRLIKYVGDISFGIYLTHVLLLGALNKTIFQITTRAGFPINTVLVLILSVLWISIARIVLSKAPYGERIIRWFGLC